MAVEHNTLPSEAQHIIHRWKVADETALNSIVPTIDDLDKIALRQDNDTFYRLKSHDPIEWVAVGSSGTVDLSNYYTKPETDALIPTIPEFKTINGEVITGTGDIVISGGGSATTLADLTDTSITTPTDLQTLTYNQSTGKWENKDINSELAQLVDDGLTNCIVKMTQIQNTLHRYAVTQNTWVKIPFDVKEVDTKSLYDTTNHRFIVQSSGYYLIQYSIEAGSNVVSSTYETFGITKNLDSNPVATDTSGSTVTAGEESTVVYYENLATYAVGFGGTRLVYLNENDVLRFWYKSQHTSPYLQTCNNITGNYAGTNISIAKISTLSSNTINTAYNAYELAIQEGFVGTLTDWLNSLKGTDGTNGLNGADGADGLSAYQVWLNLGNTGTEQDFINSLKGETGATGANGADGIDGVGVPTGGTAGQILAKVDATDYNTAWIDAPTGGGSAEYPDQTSNAGKFLSTDGTDVLWDDIPQPVLNGLSELPKLEVGVETLTSQRWIDGKPIYSITIDFGVVPNNTAKTVAIPNFSIMQNYWIDMANSWLKSAGSDVYPMIFFSSSTTQFMSRIQNSTGSVWVDADNSGFAGGQVYFTIRYTKSTDTASSPVALIGGKGLSELPAYQLGVEVLTSERWTNGKPIYKKTIDFGALPNTTTKNVAHGVSDLEFGFLDKDMSYSIVTATPTAWYPLDLSTNNTSANRYAYVTSSNVSIVTYTDRTTLSAIITIRYTKTTDTASSPVALVGSSYNISSAEYVLPYTRNGKTMYGIEVDFGTLPNATTKSVTIPNYNSAYKYLISGDSYAYDPVNKSTRPLPSPHATNLIDLSLSNGLIYITCSGNRSAFTESKVVLHYTKN